MEVLELKKDVRGLAELWPGERAPALFPIDPAKLRALFFDEPGKQDATLLASATIRENRGSLTSLRARLPRRTFDDVQQSLGYLLRYGDRLFPGFRCIYGEFINDDWLGLVDYHKAFHRDHIIHQAQEALIVRRLLDHMQLCGARHPLARACREAEWSGVAPYSDRVTVREVMAYVLAAGTRDTTYLYARAGELGVPPALIQPQTPACYWFWHRVVYDAAVTAALYHDIGYPLQFVNTVARKIEQSRFAEVVRGGDARQVHVLFDDPLCLMPFRGYHSSRYAGLPYLGQREVDEAIGTALRDTHGMPGALTFLYLNQQVMDTRDERRIAVGRLVVELAALAIAMHDMQGVYVGKRNRRSAGDPPRLPRMPERPHMRLLFRRDPVSAIVTLADQIQNYGRFNAAFCEPPVAAPVEPPNSTTESRRPDAERTVTYELEERVELCRLEYEPDGSSLRLMFAYDREHVEARFRQAEQFNPEAEADFFDMRLGFLDLQGLFARVTLGEDYVDDAAHT